MKDGIIELGTKAGDELGFTSDKFMDGSYLWKVGDYIYISVVKLRERGKGYLSTLFANILSAGYGIKVPTPLPLMEKILKEKEFRKIAEYSENVEVWAKEKNK